MKFDISAGDDRICTCGSKDVFAYHLSKSIYKPFIVAQWLLTYALFIKNLFIYQKIIYLSEMSPDLFKNPE